MPKGWPRRQRRNCARRGIGLCWCGRVGGEPLPYAEKAMVMGPARVIPRELPGVTVSLLYIALPDQPRRGRADLQALAVQVLEELLSDPSANVAALRGGRRFV